MAIKRNLAVHRPRNLSRIFRRRINYGYEVRAQLRLRNNLELVLYTRLRTLIRKFVRIQADDFLHRRLYLKRAEKQFLEDLKLILARHYRKTFIAIYERNSMVYQNLQKKQDAFDWSNVDFEKLVAGYISTNTIRLEGISIALTNKIRNIISSSHEEGLGIEKIADKLQQSAPGLSSSRARTISRTETHSAASWANHKYHMDVADSVDLRLVKEWVAVSDGRTRPEHAEANGQTVDAKGKFVLSHPKLGTVLMDTAGDPAGGAYHVINCRCVIVYKEKPAGQL